MAQSGFSRRQVLALAGAAGGASGLPGPAAAAAGDPIAGLYHRILLLHTRWVERQWDARLHAYPADGRFTAVLGNAVLLTTGGYDAGLAGVDRATLRTHTLATIKRYAAANRLAGGTDWGRQVFPDSTFQLYFVLAARLLWDQLEDQTRANVLAIAAGQAAYTYELNTADDPLSPGRTPNGRQGGWIDDSKLIEMGGYAQALAPGAAWIQDRDWLGRFTFWMSNATGLPVADRANPAVPAATTSHNIYDTFVVERGGAVDPHAQAETWRIAGRAAAHFVVAGRPLPPVLTRLPNGRELWATLMLLAGDAGEPVMPMIASGYHRYAHDVLPLAFLAQIQGDRYAARAEADLAARLLPYVRSEPAYRLAKFGGDEPDEPEARAQLAIAYLLHRGSPTRPVTRDEFLRAAAGTRVFGADVGLTVHQSANAFAAAVTKEKFANFVWQPRHDNWLVDARAAAFLPPGAHPPTQTWSTAYRRNRDGLDATATVLRFGDTGAAGFTTLPTGTVVYASTGIGTDEGGLTLFNLRMPGVPGLTGRRTFTGASGSVTLGGGRGGGGNGGIDELAFAPRPARYVRMLGRRPANEYGYSIRSFGVLDRAGGDLAQGAVATGSSADVWCPAVHATDGNPETRWAVAPDQRRRVDSWLAIDLGSVVPIAGVRLDWDTAYATRYVIQTSTDAQRWTDAVAVPDARMLAGTWVDIDGRAGLVTHDSTRPIVVTATGVIAASGPAAEVTVEGYARSSVDLAAAARRRLPVTGCGLRISDADGYLSVFNLTGETIADAAISLPTSARLYLGMQIARDGGLEWTVTQPGATARVEPPRFTVEGTVPDDTRFTLADSHHLTISAPERAAVAVTVRSGSWSAAVSLDPGRFTRLVVPGGPVTPTADLARGRTTFPTSPLPAGMTAPGLAVDGDPRTAWRPGPSGRMVVDLGAVCAVSAVRLTWTTGRVSPARLESSTDGLSYPPVNLLPQPFRAGGMAVNLTARYVAVTVVGWRPGNAELAELAVFA